MTKTMPKILEPLYRWHYVANTNAKAARKAIMFKSMSNTPPQLKSLEFDFSGLEPPKGERNV